MPNYELVTAVIFYLLLAIIIYINRKRFEVIDKIVLAYRTQAPIKFMEKLAKYKRFWRIFSTISIPISFFLMASLLYTLLGATLEVIMNKDAPAAVGLIIPGVKVPGSPVFLPFWFGIISIAILAVIHEFAHGIVALSEGIPIKSSGFGFLLVLPVAFVEPDEKIVAEKSKLSRMRMIAAGPMSNIFFAFILTIVAGYTLAPFLNSIIFLNGISVAEVAPNLPAEKAGLTEGLIITGINGVSTPNITHFAQTLRGYKPGDAITLNSKDNDYAIELTGAPQNTSLPYMGVSYKQNWEYKEEAIASYSLPLLKVFSWFGELIGWIVNLNFAVGMVNLLPVWFVDGGQLLTNGMGYIVRKKETLVKILNSIFYLALSLLLINILLPLYR